MIGTIFWKWMKYIRDAKVNEEFKSVYFEHCQYDGYIQFDDASNQMMLSVWDRQKQQVIFYQYFEMEDLKMTYDHLLSFFKVLKKESLIATL